MFHTSDRPLPPVPIPRYNKEELHKEYEEKEKERAIEKILEKYIEKFIKYKSRFNKKSHDLLHITKITKRFFGEVIYAKSFIDTVRKRHNIPEETYNIMKKRIERFEEVANALVKYAENIYRQKSLYQRFSTAFFSMTLVIFGIIIKIIYDLNFNSSSNSINSTQQDILYKILIFTWILLTLALTFAIRYFILYIRVPNVPNIFIFDEKWKWLKLFVSIIIGISAALITYMIWVVLTVLA